jgi:hypothetical protein
VTPVPDLLTHVLVGYTLATVLRVRFDRLSPAYVTVCMAGTLLPDTAKLYLVVPDAAVATLLGVPFSWYVLHTLGGVVVAVSVGGVLARRADRLRVVGLLSLGAVSHLAADELLLTASGYSKPMLWPLVRVEPPMPGLYLSTGPTPLVAASVAAVAVSLFTRRVRLP